MSKNTIALFKATIQAPNGTQNAIVMVTTPTKTWQHVVFSYDLFKIKGEEGCPSAHEVVVHYASIDGILQTDEFYELMSLAKTKDYDTVNMVVKTDPVGTVKLIEKLDDALAFAHPWIKPASLDDVDLSASASTLKSYLAKHFVLEDTVKDNSSLVTSKKIAYPKQKIDWDKTWNSDVLTDEEKTVLSPEVDLDIAMSNDSRETRHIFEKYISTKYATRKFTLIGLHGNPAAGKTAMVLYDYCAMNHIPVIYIPCDPLMTVGQTLAQVGPVNQNNVVSQKDIKVAVEALKAQLFAAQSSGDMDEVGKITDKLAALAQISKETADLVKSPSILYKCLRYNLPLVVLFDEANLMTISQQNAWSPIMSDATFKDGPFVYHNDYTIKWVMAWNPNTSNTKSFNGKFYDRISFIQVEDVDPRSKREYRARKTVQTMYGSPNTYIQDIEKQAADLVSEHPELKDKVAAVMDVITRAETSSANSKRWFFDKKVKEFLGTADNPKNGEFNAFYADEVSLAGPQETAQAVVSLGDFIDKVNVELAVATKGRDTKNPDKNSVFYIADRCQDMFCDLVFGYGDVEPATKRFIYDLIPGGHTVKTNAVNRDALGVDHTPEIIAQTIVEKLGGDIHTLNNQLFKNVSKAEVDQALDTISAANYEEAKWKVVAENVSDVGDGIEQQPLEPDSPINSSDWDTAENARLSECENL